MSGITPYPLGDVAAPDKPQLERVAEEVTTMVSRADGVLRRLRCIRARAFNLDVSADPDTPPEPLPHSTGIPAIWAELEQLGSRIDDLREVVTELEKL